ncbi:uncharacterized protein LOC132294343 [Cornus florida]|uniref:uncharacterized protein LOC132294343 n=1 Tax=Cornus florida TaxID=4283 RepID=UPI0028A0116C|nr:uncharacterized protein LOC132294343 [Cornus florida]XP_059648152.1 uncharacterized protein LOC132294343 [Cornus florida]
MAKVYEKCNCASYRQLLLCGIKVDTYFADKCLTAVFPDSISQVQPCNGFCPVWEYLTSSFEYTYGHAYIIMKKGKRSHLNLLTLPKVAEKTPRTSSHALPAGSTSFFHQPRASTRSAASVPRQTATSSCHDRLPRQPAMLVVNRASIFVMGENPSSPNRFRHAAVKISFLNSRWIHSIHLDC